MLPVYPRRWRPGRGSCVWSLLVAVLALGCGEEGGGQPAPARPLDRQAVLRFLRAHPVLQPQAAAVYRALKEGGLSGEEVVRMRRGLDEAARRFGYPSFRVYEETAARISRAAAFLRLARAQGRELEPPAGITAADVEAVSPYVDDVARVEAEARRRASVEPAGR